MQQTAADEAQKTLQQIETTVKQATCGHASTHTTLDDPVADDGVHDIVTICDNCNAELKRETVKDEVRKQAETKKLLGTPTLRSEGTSLVVTLKAGDGTGADIVIDSSVEANMAESQSAARNGQFFMDGSTLCFKLPDCPDSFTAPGGSMFVGWSWEGTGKYQPGSVFTITGDLVLTALWEHGDFNISYRGITENGDSIMRYGSWDDANPSAAAAGDQVNLKIISSRGNYDSGIRLQALIIIQDNGTRTESTGFSYNYDFSYYTCSFTMPAANVTLNTRWETPSYFVTVTTDGNGTASANPEGGNTRTNVTLTAVPNDGYVFDYWESVSGGGFIGNKTDNPFSFRIRTDNVEAKAHFKRGGSYNVSVAVSPDNGGTVTGAGTYYENSTVTVSASPGSGYRFVNWSSNDGVNFADANASTTTFKSPAHDVTVTANFEVIPATTTYTVSASVNDNIMGTVTGAGTYDAGATVTLTATANEGYTFVNWTENGSVIQGAGATYSFTAEADRNLVANFAEKETVAAPTFDPAEGTFTAAQSITISCATEGATIYYTADGTEPTTGNTVYSGPISVSETTTIKAIAVKDGMNKSEVASAAYTITPPATTYTVTASVNDDAMGTASASPASGASGTEVTLTATPNQGYQFKEWTVISGGVTITDNKFSIGTDNVEVRAVFEAIPAATYTVTYKVVNGTWADGTTADKTETVAHGASPASVPTGMIAGSGYTSGIWVPDPSTAVITEAATFVYEFIYNGRKLDSITVTPPTKTQYNVGDELDTTGMVVLAYYDNGGQGEDVTGAAKISNFDSSVPGTVIVTVSYTERETTRTDTFSVTIVEPVSVSYNISVSASPSEGGTVTGGGWYEGNAQVTVTATANSGYSFVKWTENGNQVSTSASYTFNATAYRTLVAVFEAIPTYTLTVENGTGSGDYAEGASVKITANDPETGNVFKEWTGTDGLTFTSGSATTATATFTMPAQAVTVTATYEKGNDPAVVTPTASVLKGGKTVDLTKNVTGAVGSLSFSITQALEGCSVTPDGLFTSGSVSGTCTVQVTIRESANYKGRTETITVTVSEEPQYPIEVKPAEGGKIETEQTTAAEGDTVTLTVKPDEGYKVDTITVKNGEETIAVTEGENGTYTYTAPGAPVTVSVTFVKQTFTVIFADWNGTELQKIENVEYGDTPAYSGNTPTRAATEETTYTFSGWDKEIVPVKADVTYTARYEEVTNVYEISYAWSEDNSTVTATRKCTNNPALTVTETVNTEKTEKKPTCEEKGEMVYTAAFTNTFFSTQRKTTEEAALGHLWKVKETVWASDHSSITVTLICEHDMSHTRIVNAQAVPEAKDGKIIYTAKVQIDGDEIVLTAEFPEISPEEIPYVFTQETKYWVKGSTQGAVYRVTRSAQDNLTYSLFNGIKVDGVQVSAYDKAPGSIIITLHPAYLNTLSAGWHRLIVYFTDGSVSTDFLIRPASSGVDPYYYGGTGYVSSGSGAGYTYVPPSNNPRTGDESNLMLWGALAVVSAAGIALLIVRKRKKT